ncbi:hypothetical protein [Moraxella lacunata]|uniref:hypothetical protein n=1 Tax=Moraxella lacunata TaxID=477 RepID=UPI003EE3767C
MFSGSGLGIFYYLTYKSFARLPMFLYNGIILFLKEYKNDSRDDFEHLSWYWLGSKLRLSGVCAIVWHVAGKLFWHIALR